MKKVMLIAAMAALGFSSCKKDPVPPPAQCIDSLATNILTADDVTKYIAAEWSNKDTLAPKKLHYTVMAYASQAPGADSAVVFTKDTTISSIGYGSFDGYFPKGTAVYWRVYESSYIGSSTVPCKTYTSDAVAEFPRPVAK
jgi:hypothetical protein